MNIYAVIDGSETVFTWDYDKGARPILSGLYEKAKFSQWNGHADLPWNTDVDQDKVVAEMSANPMVQWLRAASKMPGSPLRSFGEKQWNQLLVENHIWQLSQFMHGEQGALVCSAKIARTVPWVDAKYAAAAQVVDEARHVEVFARYLDQKLSGHYPINVHLKALLRDIIRDGRWDMTYLGMQVMVEGLALAAFGLMRMVTEEPLLKQLLRYVMTDEARHVGFGVQSLKEYYGGLSGAELRERQEFALEAAVTMRERLQQQEVWERLGIDARPVVRAFLEMPPEKWIFHQLLFSRIIPICGQLGLLDANDGWLRSRFRDIGVIRYEHERPGRPRSAGALAREEVGHDAVGQL